MANDPEIDLAAVAISRPLHPAVRALRKRPAAAAQVKARKERRTRLRRRRLKQKKRGFRTKAFRARLAAERGPAPKRGGLTQAQRLLLAMEPGEWWGAGELATLTGIPLKNVDARLRCSGNRPPLVGLVEKGRNAAGAKTPWARFIGDCEPVYLWRLTPAGERAREVVLLLT